MNRLAFYILRSFQRDFTQIKMRASEPYASVFFLCRWPEQLAKHDLRLINRLDKSTSEGQGLKDV